MLWGAAAILLVISVFLPERYFPTSGRKPYSRIVLLILACLLGMKDQTQLAVIICSVMLLYVLCERYRTEPCQSTQENSKST